MNMKKKPVASNAKIKIRDFNTKDAPWIDDYMEKNWGGLPLVIRGQKYFPSKLEGLVIEQNSDINGFLFYEFNNTNCEIIVFEVFDKFLGSGSKMLKKLIEIVKNRNGKRIFLMTTNDNLDALRFYQKRGFRICGIHIDSVKKSREIKPTIGFLGDYDIPVRDEIDLEYILQ